MKDECWIKRDGTRIAVGDMDVEHLRNTLRMLIRNRRRRQTEALNRVLDEGMSYWDYKDASDGQAHRDLANPNVFFPLLDGGVHGSPELQKKYGG